MKTFRDVVKTIFWLSALAIFFYFVIADPHTLDLNFWIYPR